MIPFFLALVFAQPPELPAPREVDVPIETHLDPMYLRSSRYDVWQVLAVDRRGGFKPRVIYTPYDRAYYLYNGKPYPWTTTHQIDFMPYIVD